MCIRDSRQVFKHGIRVGSISPGPVITSLLSDWPEEKLKEARESGSLIEASEIANVVMFMLTRPRGMTTVSYTHLDVYKRQARGSVKETREMALAHPDQRRHLSQQDLMLIVTHHKANHAIDFFLQFAVGGQVDMRR